MNLTLNAESQRRVLLSAYAGLEPVSTSLTFEEATLCLTQVLDPWSLDGMNACLAAASPLLVLSTKTQTHKNFQPDKMYECFIHEIKAFEHYLKRQHCSSDKILIARYLLCAFLDQNNQKAGLKVPALLSFFYQEKEKKTPVPYFFEITETLMQDPALNLELIELIYLLLKLGYDPYLNHGIHNPAIDNHVKIQKMTEMMFDRILEQRKNLKKDFFIKQDLDTSLKLIKPAFPFFLMILFMIMLLLTLFLSNNYFLSHRVSHVYQQVDALNNETNPALSAHAVQSS